MLPTRYLVIRTREEPHLEICQIDWQSFARSLLCRKRNLDMASTKLPDSSDDFGDTASTSMVLVVV